MPVIDDINRLAHIVDSAQTALEFVSEKQRSDLDKDAMLSLALVRLLEIIGEAARGMSEDLRSKYPEIAWRQMASMRNRLIHGYFEVNLDTVWETVTKELPPLLDQLEKIIAKETR
jgi:uncharacterized protein with HEPN domain